MEEHWKGTRILGYFFPQMGQPLPQTGKTMPDSIPTNLHESLGGEGEWFSKLPGSGHCMKSLWKRAQAEALQPNKHKPEL